MYPTIFKIGDFAIHSYGLMMALGFLCAWHIAAKLQKKSGTIKIDLSNLLFLLMVAGVLGSRVYYVIQFWHEQFAGNLLEIIRIDHGGLVFYGGLICSIATCILYCIVRKVPLVPLGDLLLCVVPLGHAFGRIGCFLNGCCYGELASKCGKVGELFNVSFPPGSPAYEEQLRNGLIFPSATCSMPVLPTQIFEAVLNLILAAVLIFVYAKTKGREKGLTIAGYFTGYGAVRIAMELLRGDVRAGGIAISCALIVAGIGFICWRRFSGKETVQG